MWTWLSTLWGANMQAAIEQIIEQALREAQARGVVIYTFALYLDHESSAISVCLDTREKSRQVVARMNAFNSEHFLSAVEAGDLETVALWQGNVGRSLSLGDFAMVNVARTDFPRMRQARNLIVAMLQAVVKLQEQIVARSVGREDLILCCSGLDDEAQYVWSAVPPRA